MCYQFKICHVTLRYIGPCLVCQVVLLKPSQQLATQLTQADSSALLFQPYLPPGNSFILNLLWPTTVALKRSASTRCWIGDSF